MVSKRSAKATTSAPGREPEPLDDTSGGVGVSATLIVGVLLTLIVIILAVQNTEQAEFEFLAWDTSTPLVVILLSAVLIGVVFDEIAGLWWRHRRRRQLAEKSELQARRAASRRHEEPIEGLGPPPTGSDDGRGASDGMESASGE